MPWLRVDAPIARPACRGFPVQSYCDLPNAARDCLGPEKSRGSRIKSLVQFRCLPCWKALNRINDLSKKGSLAAAKWPQSARTALLSF